MEILFRMDEKMKISGLFPASVFLVSSLSLLGCASTPSQEGTGEYFDDTVITSKVKSAILNDPKLKVGEINVKTSKGIVRLRGYVNSQAKVNEAVTVSAGIPGVKGVRNELYIKDPAPLGNTKPATKEQGY